MGLYPDGTFGMAATSYGTIYTPQANSRLFDTRTGAAIAAPGWDSVVDAAGTPSFSPDGKQIAFMHLDASAHTIAKADFEASTKTFSNVTDLATDPSGYVAWPAFTPDGKSILYQTGSDSTFETDCGYTGDLSVVDVASKTVHRLDVLDGYSGSGTASYLPANDPGFNFAPTMLAEAVGGYFWAIFTTHRSYGNLLASKADSGGIGVSNCFTSAPGRRRRRSLWVADDIDIGGANGTLGHRPDCWQLFSPYNVILPRRAGDRRRQPARLLGAARVRRDRQGLRVGRRVLQRLLPRRVRQHARLRDHASGLRERVREVHDGLGLLHPGGSVHQRAVRGACGPAVGGRRHCRAAVIE